jgi:SpoVK/Ycf46/Vps4 family AAA+-type ATPase
MNNQVVVEHYAQEYEHEKGKVDYDDQFFLLKNDILVNLYNHTVYLLFEPKLEDIANDLFEKLKKFIAKPKKKTTEISLIINARHGLDTKEVEVKKPNLNFDLHYNNDFKPIHKTILKQLRKPKSNGLFLFHGKPGTGKSTYIKYLMHQQNKQVIFLSPNMAGSLDNMNLTEFLMDTPNCVLVIEDAEDLIISRDNFHNSKLSFILNLTDGILGDSLGIQIIATFNTDLKNIDKALLRKGRLSAIYEFKELATDKSNALLQKLGQQKTVSVPTTLADLFNMEVENNIAPAKKTVGFK